MKPFEYVPARSVAEATAALAEYRERARVLAGGTDLLVELRRPNASTPEAVVDIGGIDALGGIGDAGDDLTLGPLTRHTQLQRSALVQRHARLLGVACASVGSPQIRNRGTLGGNIMNAATCADTVPPLVALGARLTLQARGQRTVNIEDFFVKPYKTRAEPDEVLVQVTLTKLPAGATSAFIKLGRRNALSISRLSVAAVLVRDERGVFTEARIVPGAALPTWT
ncbi:MAG: FAD binding domain-containing protein, partial [Myxococcota bacterium]